MGCSYRRSKRVISAGGTSSTVGWRYGRISILRTCRRRAKLGGDVLEFGIAVIERMSLFVLIIALDYIHYNLIHDETNLAGARINHVPKQVMNTHTPPNAMGTQGARPSGGSK